MNAEDYFGMIVSILVGLTFIALILAFLYLVYGEEGESASSSKTEFLKNIYKRFLVHAFNFFNML